MKLVPNGLSRAVSTSLLKTKMNSPHILFVGGVVAIIAGGVLACKATLEADKLLDEFKTEIQDVKTTYNEVANSEEVVLLDERSYHKDLGYVYTKGVLKIGRLYAPAIIVGGVGIAAVTGSHIQLTRRNTALTATLAAVSKAFNDYRDRVRDELGEERELEIHRALSDQKVEIDGKKQLVKTTNPNKWSAYARFFDEESPDWQKNAEYNRVFLQAQQTYANNLLQARGHVFLNEVYNSLGLSHTQAGAVVGWVIGDEGDNYIDFGMHEAYNKDFMSGDEPRMILDFNVDGVIYNKIKERN